MAPKTASFDLERAAGAERGRLVVGVDEVGRGPWAGPVVAAAAWLDMARLPADMAAGLRDSKTLRAAARTAAREVVAEHRAEEALQRAGEDEAVEGAYHGYHSIIVSLYYSIALLYYRTIEL